MKPKIIVFQIAFLLAIFPIAAKTYLYTGLTNLWAGRTDGVVLPVAGNLTTILNAIPYNEEVWMAAGEYSTTATIVLKTGVQLYGGFVGTEAKINDRVLQDTDNGVVEGWEFKFPTIIKGVGKIATAVTYSIFNFNKFNILNGVTIDGHNTTNTNGGAIFTNDRAIISKCIIRNIKTTGNGAGVYSNAAGGALVSACLIENCDATSGGAIYLSRKGTVFQSVLRNNSATNGGAIYFNQNVDTSYVSSIMNNAIYNNTATGKGGAIYLVDNDYVNPVIIAHNSIVNNQAVTGGGGIIGIRAGTKLYQNILYNNYQGSTGANTLSNLSSTLTSVTLELKNNAFNAGLSANTGLVYGIDNIETLSLPGFVLPSTSVGRSLTQTNDVKVANFALLSSSPLLKGGIANLSTITVTLPMIDLLGNTRPTVDPADIGAYQYSATANIPSSNSYKHFIIYGQSISTGQQSYPSISTDNVLGNFMVGNQVWKNLGGMFNYSQFTPLVSNIAAAYLNQTTYPYTRISAIHGECAITGAVNHIQLKNPGDKLVASSCGTGGKLIESLSKHSETQVLYSSDFLSTIAIAKEISNFSNSKISCPAICWSQGEANYGVVLTPGGTGLTAGSLATGDKNAYKALLLNLKNDMQNDIQNLYEQADKPLFMLVQPGAQWARGKELSIGMAQLEATNENSDMVCIGPYYQMTDRGGHLDPNGYRWFGELIGKVYYKTAVLKERFKPLQPKEISRTSLPNQLKVKYMVSYLPLVLDELTLPKVTNYGFEVFLNNVLQTLTSVTIDGDCVYLTCAAPLIGDVEVTYSGSTARSGNLRDSDPYQAFYNYIDLDKKNAVGTFFYPRDITETTLRPPYEPKDATGNVIYDKPYPLYNFGVTFYYKMLAAEQSVLINSSELTTNSEVKTNQNISVLQSGNSILLKNKTGGKVSLRLYNSSGLILQSRFAKNEKIKISMSTYPAGVYILKIEQEGGMSTHKIVYQAL